MSKPALAYPCTACSASHPKWFGRCPTCKQFGTIAAEPVTVNTSAPVGMKTRGATSSHPAPRKLVDVAETPATRTPIGIPELDRTIGGGLLPSHTALLFGPAGAGKSTLLLAAAAAFATAEHPVLYNSSEEAPEQIANRATRTGADNPHVYIADYRDVTAITDHARRLNAGLVIVDSVQTTASPDLESSLGSVTQINEVTNVLCHAAKTTAAAYILVGQLNARDELMGPRALAHAVDTLLSLTSDRDTSLRILTAEKNRFGPSSVSSVWLQESTGITAVPDPSALFLSTRTAPTPGTCVTAVSSGQRTLLVEIQAITAPTQAANPRRTVQGIDSGRVALLAAVLDRACQTGLAARDIYAATAGGARVTEPGADLATILALASATWDVALPLDMAAIGEVALSSDVRQVPDMAARMRETARRGYTRIITGPGAGVHAPDGSTVIEITTIADIVDLFRSLRQRRAA